MIEYGLYICFLVLICFMATIMFFRYNKSIKARNAWLVLFAISMILFLQNKPDIENYAFIYYNPQITDKDKGFEIVAHLFSKLGLSYMQFQNLYCILALVIIIYATMRLTKYRFVVYMLFILYPFFIQVIQIRNFMFAALLFLAISVCSTTNNLRRRKLYWCVLIILAGTQHILALAFLPFGFVMDKNTYTRKLPIIMTVITVAFLVIPSPFIYIIEAIVHLLIKDFRADLYTVRVTRVGWILMIGKSVCLIFIANMSFHYERRYAQVLGDSQERYALNEGFYELLKSLFEYGALFWPLYVLNGEYTRLMQNEAIMVYIGIVMIIKCKLPTNILLEDRVYLYIKKKHILFSFYCLFIYDILTLWIGNSRTVVEPLLVNFM